MSSVATYCTETSSIAMSLVEPSPVVAEKRIVVVEVGTSTCASCHETPWFPERLQCVVQVSPSSDDAPNSNIPIVAPYILYQNVTDLMLVTSLSRTKGPTDGLFGDDESTYM